MNDLHGTTSILISVCAWIVEEAGEILKRKVLYSRKDR